MSDKNSYILILLVGLVLGVLLYLGFQDRENISNWFAGLTNNENEEEADETYPYFAAGVREYYLGDDSEWKFQVFQPEVVEYVDGEDSEGGDTGLNYVLLRYSPDEDLNKEYEVRALLTIDEEGWFPESADIGFGLDENDLTFQKAVNHKLRILKTFDSSKADTETNASLVTLETFKKAFPVGTRISMMVPVSYPLADQRTPIYCAGFEDEYTYMCEYGAVLDKLSAGLKDFNNQREVGDDFTLIPYYYSSELTSDADLE